MKKKTNPKERVVQLPPLQREDWVFNSCPRELLLECLEYEYGKERIIQNLRGKSLSDLPDQFKKILKLPPYLKRKIHEDKKQIEEEKKSNPYFKYYNLAPEERLAFRTVERPEENFRPNEFRSKTPYQDYAIRIDWSFSNETLVEVFNAWIARYRPTSCKAKTGQSRSKTYLKKLKALAVFRLIQRHGTVAKAMDYAWEQDGGLYDSEGDWSRAKALAQKILNENEYFLE